MNLRIKSTSMSFGITKIVHFTPKILPLIWIKHAQKIISLESNFSFTHNSTIHKYFPHIHSQDLGQILCLVKTLKRHSKLWVQRDLYDIKAIIYGIWYNMW